MPDRTTREQQQQQPTCNEQCPLPTEQSLATLQSCNGGEACVTDSRRQPEEEASMDSQALAMVWDKPEAEDEELKGDCSRSSYSTRKSVDEPALEPQPKDSPRKQGFHDKLKAIVEAELKKHEDEDQDDEPVETLHTAEPSVASFDPTTADGQDTEGVRNEDEEGTSVNSSVRTDTTGVDDCELSDESPLPSAINRPQAGQEGMPRSETLLHMIEQNVLNRTIVITVPEGMDHTRVVNFNFEAQLMKVTIPDGYVAGQQVQITVPTGKRPPLERNVVQAWHRGHQHFPDRHCVMEPLKHCCRVVSQISLDHPEFKQRYALYGMLQGKSMHPLLPDMPEENEENVSDFEAEMMEPEAVRH
ncbi:unnamed protein product [Polarella glacialis]|uniref:Uncharacterized protein n=1 Tax=Polarella glacialis TaxID=89957 RepID=A0A813KCR3_POLGL|nr:unnamed protein product [Polarella glacialis]